MATTHVYHIPPIPPVESAITRFPAGSVTIGLELRELNEAIVEGFYGDRPEVDEVRVNRQSMEAEDGGPTIHVFGTDDGREYLRFDCFRLEPHYHFVLPDESYQIYHELDESETGDTFEWAISSLRERLPELLEGSGGAHLTAGVDRAKFDSALDSVVAMRERANSTD